MTTHPIYTQVPKYVPYELPFARYFIRTPFGSGEINVSRIFLSLYPERLAVAMTAWGNIREKFSLYQDIPERNAMRDAFIKAVEFEKRF